MNPRQRPRLALIGTEKLPTPPIQGGAIQTYIAGVIPHLARHYELTVVGPAHPLLPDREVVDGVRYVRISHDGKPQVYVKRVAKLLARKSWSLIEVFNRPESVPTLAEAAPGTPFVLSLHNDMFEPNKIEPVRAHACLDRVSALVTISDYVGRRIVELYPEARAKMRTIRSGVDLDRFHPRPKATARREVALDLRRFALRRRPLVLHVTRLSPKKGTHIVVEAMKQVVQTHPEAGLLVVGSKWYGDDSESPYTETLRDQALELGDAIRFTGYVPYPRMPGLFALADIFLCASQWQEPLARVHYEAMASGLPILSTDRGGNSEVVEEGGNGYLVRPHDSPEAFAEAIRHLLDHPALRRRLGRRGRQMAEERFGWSRVADDLLAVFAPAAADRPRLTSEKERREPWPSGAAGATAEVEV
jgi:spore coat protein SA